MWQQNTDTSHLSLRNEFTEEHTANMFILSYKVRCHEHRRIVVLTSVWWYQVYHRPSTRPAEGWRVGRWEMDTSLPLTLADRSDRRPWKCAQKPGNSENLWHSFLYPSKLKLNLEMKLFFIFFWRKFAWGDSGSMWICMYMFVPYFRFTFNTLSGSDKHKICYDYGVMIWKGCGRRQSWFCSGIFLVWAIPQQIALQKIYYF
jgi:hypothetical protein